MFFFFVLVVSSFDVTKSYTVELKLSFLLIVFDCWDWSSKFELVSCRFRLPLWPRLFISSTDVRRTRLLRGESEFRPLGGD